MDEACKLQKGRVFGLKLLCIDGNSIMNRAFFGIRLLSNRQGVYTNALFGFLNILQKLIREQSPDRIAVTFDKHAPTFRHERYEAYKGTRKGMPEELRMQMPYIKEIVAAFGYAIYALDGFEADDLLGTLSAHCEENGDECVIATGDRDCLQLIGGCTKVLLIKTKENILYDQQKLMEDYNVTPTQVVELKALMGDASDNIPGVRGIGEKTALGLLAQAPDLRTLYEKLDVIKTTPRIREMLRTSKAEAELSKELATICRSAPIDFSALKQAQIPDREKLTKLFTELEMVSFLEKFDLTGAAEEERENGDPPYVIIADGDVDKAAAVFAKRGRLDFLNADGSLQAVDPVEKTVYVFTERYEEAFDALLTLPVKKRTFMGKSAYRHAMKKGRELPLFDFDLELAAYLLLPTANEYAIGGLRLKYGLSAAAQTEYADILSLSALCDIFEREIEQNGLHTVLYEIELPLCRVLASMEEEGFAVDKEGLAEYGGFLSDRVEDSMQAIFDAAGMKFNPNSTKELGYVLFEKLGLPAKKKTKRGYSTNAEVLEELRGFHPIIGAILEYRRMSKLYSTYIIGLLKVIGEDGRVHSTFHQTLTRTGRISSAEPNVQNIPIRTEEGSEIRRYFVAKPGYTLVDADYSQIELRVLAHMADDRQMLDGFAHGADIHRMTASQVFGIPLEDVTPQMRSRSKAINFGIVYGIGAFSLSKDIHVSVAEARRYIDQYLRTYSGVNAYMKKTIEDAHKNGYVTTLYGRRRDVADINASNKQRKALGERIAMNTPIQGTAADIIKLAMVRVYERLKKEQPDAKIILQVHDELIIECPEEKAEQVSRLLCEEMETAASLKVKLEVDSHAGKNWLEAKG